MDVGFSIGAGDKLIHRIVKIGDVPGVEEWRKKVGDEQFRKDIDILDGDRRSALHYIVNMGNVNIPLQSFMISCSKRTNTKDLDGNTPLLYACAVQNMPIVRSLLAANASVHEYNEQGMDGVQFGLSKGVTSIQIAELLVEHGLDIHRTNKFGQSALHLAVRLRPCGESTQDFVRWLLALGVDVNFRDDQGQNALDLAEDLTIRSFLLQKHEERRHVNKKASIELNGEHDPVPPSAKIQQHGCHRCTHGLIFTIQENAELWSHQCKRCGWKRRTNSPVPT